MQRERQGYAALRKGRWSGPGGIYLLTTVTHRRAKHFEDWQLASVACRELHAAFGRSAAELLCWVLMPDHWHGLVQLEATCALEPLMQHFKGRVARAVNMQLGRTGPMWMQGYHDHGLRRDEDLLATARYIVANPLRAGLVKRAGDYPFWDAAWL